MFEHTLKMENFYVGSPIRSKLLGDGGRLLKTRIPYSDILDQTRTIFVKKFHLNVFQNFYLGTQKGFPPGLKWLNVISGKVYLPKKFH